MVGPGANDHSRHRKHCIYQSIKILQQNNHKKKKKKEEEEEEEEEKKKKKKKKKKINGFWS